MYINKDVYNDVMSILTDSSVYQSTINFKDPTLVKTDYYSLMLPRRYFMGKIRINLPNESVIVTFEKDTPTVAEQLKINKFITERKKVKRQPSVKKETKPEQMFDTKSGVRLVGLRATLGLSETNEDQIEALKSYGLVEGDYTRDKRGRLAITPSGGKKLNLDIKMPTLIDESGFSLLVILLDLTGIAPETVVFNCWWYIRLAPFGGASNGRAAGG